MKIMLQSKFAVCRSEDLRFIKDQGISKFLTHFRIRTPLSKIPPLGDILLSKCIKLNDIIDNFLLAGEKFMPGMSFRQSGFTYSACRTFTKNRTRIQEFKATGDSRYIYKNELDNACFQHNMIYEDFQRSTKKNLV